MRPSIHNHIFSDTDCLSREQLVGYSKKELPPEEMHAVERHLVECEFCTDALAGFALVPAATDGLEAMDKRMDALLAAKAAPAANSGMSVKRYFWLAAASVAAICLVVFWNTGQDILFPDPIAEHQTEPREPKPEVRKATTTESSTTDELEKSAIADKADHKELAEEATAERNVTPPAPPAIELADNEVMQEDAAPEIAEDVPADNFYAAEAEARESYANAEAISNNETALKEVEQLRAESQVAGRNLRADQDKDLGTSYAWQQELALEQEEEAYADDANVQADSPTDELNSNAMGSYDAAELDLQMGDSVASLAFTPAMTLNNSQTNALTSDFDPSTPRVGNAYVNDPIIAAPTSVMVPTGVPTATDGSATWSANGALAEPSAAPAEKKYAESTDPRFPTKALIGFKVADYENIYVDNDNRELRQIGTRGVPAQYESTTRPKKSKVSSEMRARAKGAQTEKPQSYEYTTTEYEYDDYLELALRDYENGHLAEAINKFTTIDEHYPQDVNASFYKGLCFYELENYGHARTMFEQILAQENNVFHEEANFYKARTLIAQKQYTAGKALLQQIVDRKGFYSERAAKQLSELE